MKWIRIATNWTFIVVMFPIFCLILIGRAIALGLKTFGIELAEAYKDVIYMFTDDYVKYRREWLINGELWPLQKKKRKKREH